MMKWKAGDRCKYRSAVVTFQTIFRGMAVVQLADGRVILVDREQLEAAPPATEFLT